MTKHPQSVLGYFQDGKMVRKPPCAPNHRTNERNQHNYSNKKKISKAERQLAQWSEPMANVRNATKKGSFAQVIAAFSDLMPNRMSNVATPSEAFYKFAKLICTKDMENRTPIYYASFAGHPRMVRFYLYVSILGKLSNVRQLSFLASKSHTIPEWNEMHRHKLPVLNSIELEVSCMSALTSDVRDIITKEVTTISNMIATVRAIFDGFYIEYHHLRIWKPVLAFLDNDIKDRLRVQPTVSVAKTVKHKRAQLNMTDPFDLSYRPDIEEQLEDRDYYEFEDEQNESYDLSQVDWEMGLVDDDNDGDDAAMQHVETHNKEKPNQSIVDKLQGDENLLQTIDLAAKTTSKPGSKQSLFLANPELFDSESEEGDDFVIVSDDGSIEGWECLSTASSKNIIVVDDFSLVSANNNKTFSGAVTEGLTETSDNFITKKYRSKQKAALPRVNKNRIKKDQEEKEDDYDAFFFQEGLKNSRGGKLAQKFGRKRRKGKT